MELLRLPLEDRQLYVDTVLGGLRLTFSNCKSSLDVADVLAFISEDEDYQEKIRNAVYLCFDNMGFPELGDDLIRETLRFISNFDFLQETFEWFRRQKLLKGAFQKAKKLEEAAIKKPYLEIG